MELTVPDLRDLMNEAADGVATPNDSTIEADLTRGRRARVRQARRRALIPAGLAAAAGVLAFSLLGTGAATDPTPPQSSSIAVALTSFQGEQPEGFSIEQVPTGWDVQAADRGMLVLAPKDAKNQNPNEFTGKILVTVANELERSVDRPNAADLKVGDVTGTTFDFAGDDGATGLLLPAEDRTLIFQFPENLNWGKDTIAEFAAGVHSIGIPEISQG
jgi:hypothetical protein